MLLQLYAEQHNDVKLMVDVMKLLNANDVPLQPGTADIIFRYINHRFFAIQMFIVTLFFSFFSSMWKYLNTLDLVSDPFDQLEVK